MPNYKIKQEMLSTLPQAQCCNYARLGGFLDSCATRISPTELVVHTHNKQLFGMDNLMSKNFALNFGYVKHGVLVCGDGVDDMLAELHCDTNNMQRCCQTNYLIGAFCGGGSLSTAKGYHLEFAVLTQTVAEKIVLLLKACDITAKIHHAKKYIVYIKDNQTIADTLVHLGAILSSLQFNNIVVSADFRKNINRATNCINANIDKALSASFKQVQAIEKLKKSGCFENLDTVHKEVAIARMQFPEYTLSQLATILCVSKSGIKHRLDKLMNIASSIDLP